MSLTQAVSLAIAHHPNVQSTVAVLDKQGANLTVAEAARYPQLSYCFGSGTANTTSCPSSSSTSTSGSGSIGLTANLTLYDFGRTSGLVNAATASQAQAQADVDAAREKVAEDVTTTYISILRAIKLRAASQDYEASLQQLETAIEQRAGSGVSSKADVIRAQIGLDSARASLISAEADERGARAMLVNLIGRDFGNLQPVDSDFSRLNRDSPLSGLNAHPAIVSAEKNAAAARYQIDAEEAARFPSIGVQGYYATDPLNKTKGDVGAMLTVKGNLYEGGAQNARILAARANENAARLQVDVLRLTNRNSFDVAAQNEAGAVSRIALAKRQLASSITTRDLYFEQYTLGTRTLMELLDAESSVNAARIAQVTAEYDRQAAILGRAIAIGTVAKSFAGAAVHETSPNTASIPAWLQLF